MMPSVDAPVGLTLVYRIDGDDQICHVNEAWREFALANGGSADLADRIIGTELWSCVSDSAVREVYRRMTSQARKGQMVQFQYRCDAPNQRRTFEMKIEAGPLGIVQFTSKLIRAESRPTVSLLERTSARNDQFVKICSWCERVGVGPSEWVEVEEAVNRLGLLLSERLPAITHGMCTACQTRFLSQIRG